MYSIDCTTAKPLDGCPATVICINQCFACVGWYMIYYGKLMAVNRYFQKNFLRGSNDTRVVAFFVIVGQQTIFLMN